MSGTQPGVLLIGKMHLSASKVSDSWTKRKHPVGHVAGAQGVQPGALG